MTIEELITEAELHLQKREIDDALTKFQKVFEVLPNEAHLASQIGVCFFHLKDMENALSFMDKAIELQPNYSYRYSSRAYILAANNQIDAAIADYEKCIELDPDDAVAYNNLGLLQEQKGWKKQAVDNYSKADELEGILQERGIETVSTNEDKNTSFQTEKENVLKQSSDSTGQKSVFHVVKEVFTDKKTFKEFINFVKSGFKLNDDE